VTTASRFQIHSRQQKLAAVYYDQYTHFCLEHYARPRLLIANTRLSMKPCCRVGSIQL
jgi:hypothetical protein